MTPQPELYDGSFDAHLDRNEQDEINADSGRIASYREIPITRGLVTRVDEEEYARFTKGKWQALIGTSGKVYAYRKTSRKEGPRRIEYLHRLVMNAGPGEQVDHRDGDGLNNQRSNLRLCTNQQNGANRGKTRVNQSGRKGVIIMPSGRLQAIVRFNGKNIYLGIYDDLDVAANAYLKKAKELFGEFARP